MRILIADDQPNVRSALRLLLEEETAPTTVTEAGNVAELITQIEASCPDLVFLDWELPGKNSVALISLIKAICPKVFVIALSSRPEARQAALKDGADDFVSKGSPPHHVLASVSKYHIHGEINHHGRERQQ